MDCAEVMEILSSQHLQETQMTLLTLRHRAQKDFYRAAESHAFRCGEMMAELNELKAQQERQARGAASLKAMERCSEEIKKSKEREEVHCEEAGNLEQWLAKQRRRVALLREEIEDVRSSALPMSFCLSLPSFKIL